MARDRLLDDDYSYFHELKRREREYEEYQKYQKERGIRREHELRHQMLRKQEVEYAHFGIDWAKEETTTETKKEEGSMNYSTAVFLINKDVRAIKVTYEKDATNKPAATYLYKTFNKEIKIGDYVVVPTSTRHGMTVCKVVEVDVSVDFDSSVEYKWVVDRINDTHYREVTEWETDATSKIKIAQAQKKREDLRKVMEDSLNGALGDIKALPLANVSSIEQ